MGAAEQLAQNQGESGPQWTAGSYHSLLQQVLLLCSHLLFEKAKILEEVQTVILFFSV